MMMFGAKQTTCVQRRCLTGAFLALVSIISVEVDAIETRSFHLDNAAALESEELEGTAVLSDGTVAPGLQLERIPLDGSAVAWSVLPAPQGGFFVGTGYEGKVLRVRGSTVSTFAETGQFAVTALAYGWNRELVAATLPEGRLFRIASDGTTTELPQLPGVEQVWDLAWDPDRRTLFAATGPEGKVFGISANGQARVYWDSDATHIMCLARGSGGDVYAGTNGDALVGRVSDVGQVEVIYDFPGNEITAIDARGGVLAVAANEFDAPPRLPNAAALATTQPVSPAPRPGKGQLWRISPEGRPERVFSRDDRYFASVFLQDDQSIVVGTGVDGTVHRVGSDGAHSLWADVEERQVLDIADSNGQLFFVTGDGGAAYRVVSGEGGPRRWTSKVQDAQYLSRFGNLSWRSRGSVQFQTRSGNRQVPDESWSAWSALLSQPGPIRSPRARFLQLRAVFPTDPDAILFGVTAHYLPQNQRGRVSSIQVVPQKEEASGPNNRAGQLPVPTTQYKVSWQMDNPDGDPSRYTIRYREESQGTWRDLVDVDDVLTDTNYNWDTRGIPDGWYILEVHATDALANPSALALDHTRQSEAILVDNHAPMVEPLQVRGSTLRGQISDEVGPIRRLEVSVNGGTYQLLHPVDGLLDSRRERFEWTLPAARPLIVSVRATDARGNQRTRELVIQ